MEVAGQLAVQAWAFREKHSVNKEPYKPKTDEC